MKKLLLVFEGEKTGRRIRDILENAGMAECILCHSAAEAKRLVYSQNISRIVCGYKFQDETAEGLLEDLPEPCRGLVLAPQSLLDLLGGGRLLKLVAPATRRDLIASVGMLLQLEPQINRGERPQRSEEERAEIEAAKKRLMREAGMTEEQAHRYLQKKSMDAGTKLPKTAHMVLEGSRKDWYH